MKGRKKKSDSHFDRSKRQDEKVNEILNGDPDKELSSKELDALFAHANELDKQLGRRWLRVGAVVSRVVNGTSWSHEEAKQEFDKRLKVGYQKAMQAKRLYKTYAKSPEEVDEYGTAAADLLTRFKTRAQRSKRWKKTGSLAKLRAVLQKTKREATAKNKPNVNPLVIAVSDKTKKLAKGLEVRNDSSILTIRIDKRLFPNAAKLAEEFQAKLLGKAVQLAA